MTVHIRILIKVNLILIQNRTIKGSATGCKDTDNFSRMLLVSLQVFLNHHSGGLGTRDWGLEIGGDEGDEGE